MAFVVEVLRNGGAEVLHIGEFEKQHHATACARRVIDSFLLKEYQTGMTADALFKQYTTAGEYPCIFRDGDNTLNIPFSHLKYAMNRCDEICGVEDDV